MLALVYVRLYSPATCDAAPLRASQFTTYGHTAVGLYYSRNCRILKIDQSPDCHVVFPMQCFPCTVKKRNVQQSWGASSQTLWCKIRITTYFMFSCSSNTTTYHYLALFSSWCMLGLRIVGTGRLERLARSAVNYYSPLHARLHTVFCAYATMQVFTLIKEFSENFVSRSGL